MGEVKSTLLNEQEVIIRSHQPGWTRQKLIPVYSTYIPQ